MAITSVSGSVWGIPVSGSIVSLSSAEVGATLVATSGLAKSLFLASSGLALGAVAVYALLKTKESAVPLSALASISTASRKFHGSCVDEKIVFICEKQELEIPISMISSISKASSQYSINLKLFDGSSYIGEFTPNSQLRFLTPIGEQSVSPESRFTISGSTTSEIQLLKENASSFLEANRENILRCIGSKKFDEYFVRG